jgi:hypothetical protein
VICGTPAPETTRVSADGSGTDPYLDAVHAQRRELPCAFIRGHVARRELHWWQLAPDVAHGNRDQILFGHHVGDGHAEAGFKAEITVGENAHQLAALVTGTPEIDPHCFSA